ncbi:HYC_CC_PP family protein [Carboxylicivirga sp. RSCT41]|uniref:HYC_CC_PP family protein n=1 Tax=Carboxylicivirga agarovorans TaxID=3417570 RepID=UPI003D32BFD1
MLKKISHILMVTVLLISTTGMTVSKHYCGGSLVNLNLFSEAIGCCEGACSSECCHNESEHYELDADFVSAVNNIEYQVATIELLFPIVQSFLLCTFEESHIELADYNPPPPKEVLTFLSDIQVYRL